MVGDERDTRRAKSAFRLNNFVVLHHVGIRKNSRVVSSATAVSSCGRCAVCDRAATRFCVGILVCRNTFLYVNAIGHHRLKAVIKQYEEEGAESRTLKYKGRNKRALTMDDAKRSSKFLEQMAEVHALDLPGRLPCKMS